VTIKRTDYMFEVQVKATYLIDPQDPSKGREERWKPEPVTVTEGLKSKPKTHVRCLGCEGLVRIHKEYVDKKSSKVVPPHAEHLRAEDAINCPRSPMGKNSKPSFS
jgi:hypothetical protein